MREFLGLAEVSQVFVISEQGDRVKHALQVMTPMFESVNDSEYFTITNVIIPFGGGEHL